MAANVKRLLAISWCMPPMVFPRSIQVSRTLMALAQTGWDITVLSSDPADVSSNVTIDPDLEARYTQSYGIVRVPSPPPNQTPHDILHSEWLKPAIKTAKDLLARGKFSILVTFAQPWVDHLIGLELCRSGRTPWVAHFSDPWVDSLYYADMDKKLLRVWRRMEKNVIRYADAVVFTNPRAVDLVMRKYSPAWQNKTMVVAHGYDPDLSISGVTASHQRMRLVHAGNVFAQRNPLALLEALRELSQARPLPEQLEVIFIGAGTYFRQHVTEMGLENLVTFQGSVPYLQSLQGMAQADVLLLIDAPSSTPSPFLPSKLVDYLMFKKPILGLTPEGASADLLRQLGCPVASPNDITAIVGAIANLLDGWQAGTLQVSPQYEQVAAAYDIHHTTGLLEEILERVRTEPRPRRWWFW